jgi:myo-inositol-1(or 4)-monophosphatase
VHRVPLSSDFANDTAYNAAGKARGARTMRNDGELRLAAAAAVVREAGSLALRYYRDLESLEVERKGPQDIVSAADRAVEDLVRERLGALFPDDAVLGEEGGLRGQTAAGTWVIDPIDGTWCFLNGIGAWCVSLAYVRDDRIEIGLIYDPNAGELFAARAGGGATLDGRPIHVARVSSLTQGTVSVGHSNRIPAARVVSIIDRLLNAGGMFHRHGSGALGLAWTACGRLIGYVEPHMNSWDALAGLLLIAEAGGYTNDFLANDGLHKGNAVLGCPMALRDVLCDLAGIEA